MAALPPFDRSWVRTADDVARERDTWRRETAMLRDQMRGMEARLSAQMATQGRYIRVVTVGAVLTSGALSFAARSLA